jgi:hypothetical protein
MGERQKKSDGSIGMIKEKMREKNGCVSTKNFLA